MDESLYHIYLIIFFLINAIFLQILIHVSHIDCEPHYLKFGPTKKKFKIRIRKPFKNINRSNVAWTTSIIHLYNLISKLSRIFTFYQAHFSCLLIHFVYSVGIFAQIHFYKFIRKIKKRFFVTKIFQHHFSRVFQHLLKNSKAKFDIEKVKHFVIVIFNDFMCSNKILLFLEKS